MTHANVEWSMDWIQGSNSLWAHLPYFVTNVVPGSSQRMTLSSQDTHLPSDITNSVLELSPVMNMSLQDTRATSQTLHLGLPHHIGEDVNGERSTHDVTWMQSQLRMEIARMTSEPLETHPRSDDLIPSGLSSEELHIVTETSQMGSMQISDLSRHEFPSGLRGPNRVGLIIIKLSWTESHIVASLCWEWFHVILTQHLFLTRVRWSAPQSLVLLSFTPSIAVRVLVLYSLTDGFWVRLPPIPTAGGVDVQESPCCSEIVVLNGKIYVIGGGLGCIGEPASHRVYMLDIAGNQCYWQRCANMKEPRASFGSAVFNGKIYVFGGISSLNTTDGSEVYDPEEDSWTSVMSMRSFSRFGHRVTTLGNEITLQGGSIIVDREFYLSDRNPLMGPSFMRQVYGDFMNIYFPGNDEWTTTMPLIRAPRELLFVVAQRLYSMSHSSIHILEERTTNSWIKVHSFELPVFVAVPILLEPWNYEYVELEDAVVVPTAVLPVNDELVAVFASKPGRCIRAPEYNFKYVLARSHGFRRGNVEISWEEIRVPHCFADAKCWYQTHSMSLIQL